MQEALVLPQLFGIASAELEFHRAFCNSKASFICVQNFLFFKSSNQVSVYSAHRMEYKLIE